MYRRKHLDEYWVVWCRDCGACGFHTAVMRYITERRATEEAAAHTTWPGHHSPVVFPPDALPVDKPYWRWRLNDTLRRVLKTKRRAERWAKRAPGMTKMMGAFAEYLRREA